MGCGVAKGSASAEPEKPVQIDAAHLDPVLAALMERQESILAEVGLEQVLWKDLKVIGPLRYTEMSHVSLVESRESGKAFAAKMVSKGFVVKNGRQNSVAQEREIWRKMRSDFIVRLYETYSLEQNLCFLMEPTLAGDLCSIYEKNQLFGNAALCRFYAAGVALALAHLHEMDCIHRDVRPETIYLTEEGRAKLGDLDSSKALKPGAKTYTTIGVPDYMTPEMIGSGGHNRAVDWWCLGIFVFELMGSKPPFTASRPMDIYKNITKGISKVKFPKACQGDVKTLIGDLLKRIPEQRTPMLPGGVKNVMAHKYFHEFDWSAMADLSMQPPWKPNGGSTRAVIDEQPELASKFPFKDDGSSWDKEFNSSESEVSTAATDSKNLDNKM
jgi:serine/threonine protein kinase